MRPWLPALIALSVTSHGAEDTGPAAGKKLPASGLLPDGSQLHGVVIPRYDRQRQLVNSLTAEVVTLVNEEIIAGSGVTIDFYDKKGQRDACIRLREATFNQVSGMMHADETVTIDGNAYKVRGAGLHYALREGRGLLDGPATTWINLSSETAMMKKTPALIGAAGIALVSQTGALATPVEAAPGNQPALVSTAGDGPIAEARRQTRKLVDRDLQDSQAAEAEVRNFVEDIPMDYEQLTGSKATPPPSGPLDFKPGPEHTVVSCDGGMYFDADKGLLVYLKNVRVDNPQYVLTGADVLTIFMARSAQPAAKDKGKPAKPDGGAGKEGPVPAIGGSFDGVEKIVASGAVRILQRSVGQGKQPVEASGAEFTYHPKTGDIILSRGFPWVKQGDFFARAKQPDLTLHMKKDGSFETQGNWEMGGRLNSR